MAIRQSYLLNGLTTHFSFPHPVRDISELKVLYNPQTSPTPTSGTEVPQSGNWTAEGVGTRSTGITVIYPAVPLSGTLIIVHSPIQSRVAGPYSLANPPTPSALNEEFDHIQAQLNGVTGGNATESIDTLDTRLDALEGQNLDSRLTDVELRALLEDTGDAKFDAENKKIKNIAQPTDSDSGHAATVDYVLSKIGGTGNVPAPLLSEVGRYLRAIGAGVYGWVQALASHIGFTPTGGLSSTDVQGALAELDSEKVSKAGDTMSGDLAVPRILISNSPGAANHGTRKDYVDSGLSGKVDISGHSARSVVGRQFTSPGNVADISADDNEVLCTNGSGALLFQKIQTNMIQNFAITTSKLDTDSVTGQKIKTSGSDAGPVGVTVSFSGGSIGDSGSAALPNSVLRLYYAFRVVGATVGGFGHYKAEPIVHDGTGRPQQVRVTQINGTGGGPRNVTVECWYIPLS